MLVLLRGVYCIVALFGAAHAYSYSSETCSTGDVYDNTKALEYVTAPATAGTCSGSSGSSVEVIRLFTPPMLPYNYTVICVRFTLSGISSTTTQAFSVVAYNDKDGAPELTPLFVKTGSTYVYSYSSSYYNRFGSVTAGLVVTRPRVFIGFRVTSACYAIKYAVSPNPKGGSGRLSLWRANSSSPWIRNKADWINDNVTEVFIRAKGVALGSTVPANWTCNESSYSDGVVCDCGCGEWDPDCNASKAGPVSPNCNASLLEVCGQSGECVATGWNSSIDGCALESFGSGDGCQCGCGGVLDPDCLKLTSAGMWYPRAVNCPGNDTVSRCSANGECVRAWPERCPASKFGDGYCDCSCQGNGSVIDPDCELPTNTTKSDCGSSHCFEGACRAFPATWTCNPSLYADSSAVCNCGCGAYDPNCNVSGATATVSGCSSSWTRSTSYVCSLSATCLKSGCGNNVTESSLKEECDGGYQCSSTCSCVSGWTVTNPLSTGCMPQCGDGKIVSNEECDSGKYCNASSCTCVAGHTAMSPRQTFCSGCGNGVVESGEECDSGSGCTENCTCVMNFETTSPLSTSCQQITYSEAGAGNSNTILLTVAVPVCASGAVGIAAVILGVAVFRHRRRRQAPNMPMDFGDISFVATSDTSTAAMATTGNASGTLPAAYASSPGSSNVAVSPGELTANNSSMIYPTTQAEMDLASVVAPLQLRLDTLGVVSVAVSCGNSRDSSSVTDMSAVIAGAAREPAPFSHGSNEAAPVSQGSVGADRRVSSNENKEALQQCQ